MSTMLDALTVVRYLSGGGLVAGLVFCLLFGGTNTGWLGRARAFVLGGFITKLFPKGSLPMRLFDRVTGYLIFSRNPLLQLFYLGLWAGGGAAFLATGLEWMRRFYPHLEWTAAAVLGSTLGTFIVACSRTPGRVDSAAASALFRTAHPADKLIFQPGRECRTCLVLKPARSKHCSLCGVCVPKYDHHCAWLNQCVGERCVPSLCILACALF